MYKVSAVVVVVVVVVYLSYYYSRLSIRLLMMCLRLSSPCQPAIVSLSSETTSSSLCTSTSDGGCGRGRGSHVITDSHPNRLYPVDRSRVNEYGEAFEDMKGSTGQDTGHMKKD